MSGGVGSEGKNKLDVGSGQEKGVGWEWKESVCGLLKKRELNGRVSGFQEKIESQILLRYSTEKETVKTALSMTAVNANGIAALRAANDEWVRGDSESSSAASRREKIRIPSLTHNVLFSAMR